MALRSADSDQERVAASVSLLRPDWASIPAYTVRPGDPAPSARELREAGKRARRRFIARNDAASLADALADLDRELSSYRDRRLRLRDRLLCLCCRIDTRDTAGAFTRPDEQARAEDSLAADTAERDAEIFEINLELQRYARDEAELQATLNASLKPLLEKEEHLNLADYLGKMLFRRLQNRILLNPPHLVEKIQGEALLEAMGPAETPAEQIDFSVRLPFHDDIAAEKPGHRLKGDETEQGFTMNGSGRGQLTSLADEQHFFMLLEHRRDLAREMGLDSFTELSFLREERSEIGQAELSDYLEAVTRYYVPLASALRLRLMERYGPLSEAEIEGAKARSAADRDMDEYGRHVLHMRERTPLNFSALWTGAADYMPPVPLPRFRVPAGGTEMLDRLIDAALQGRGQSFMTRLDEKGRFLSALRFQPELLRRDSDDKRNQTIQNDAWELHVGAAPVPSEHSKRVSGPGYAENWSECSLMPDSDLPLLRTSAMADPRGLPRLLRLAGEAYAALCRYHADPFCVLKESSTDLRRIGGECMVSLCLSHLSGIFMEEREARIYFELYLGQALTRLCYNALLCDFELSLYSGKMQDRDFYKRVWIRMLHRYFPELPKDGSSVRKMREAFLGIPVLRQSPFASLGRMWAISASLAVWDQARGKSGEILRCYENFCSLGNSDSCYRLLEEAGLPETLSRGSVKRLAYQIATELGL